jgi:hypothetical protein
MIFDRSSTRASRHAKFDVESLGERIVPAHLGFVAAGGHVNLNLLEKLASEHNGLLARELFKPTDNAFLHHHHKKPMIETAPVTFSALSTPTLSPLPGKHPVTKPILVTAPITFSALSTPTLSPLPGKHPVTKPILVTAPVIFSALSTPTLSPLPGKHPVTKPILVTAPVTFNAVPTPAPAPAPGNVSQTLMVIYEQYEQNPSTFTGATSSTNGANLVPVQGDKFGITVHDSNTIEFQSLSAELAHAGLTAPPGSMSPVSNAMDGTITGMLPIAELLTIADFSDTVSINPEMGEMAR